MKLSRTLPLSLAIVLAAGCQTFDDELEVEKSHAEVVAEGVPGSAVTDTEELHATVAAINKSKRRFTLKDEQGNMRSFTAPPEMRNFEQLNVGDKVRAQAVTERVVYLREPGAPSADHIAGMAGTPPAGSKPGLLEAETLEVSALVKAIDTTKRTVTLQFPDGTLKTVKVRPDIELKNDYLGREVVIRLTSAIAVAVERE